LEKENNLAVNDLCNAIEYRLIEAKKIVGIIAGTGMAGGYQRDANLERNSYYVWSVLTIAGFAGLIFFAVQMFYAASINGELNLVNALSRLAVVISFGVFSGYAGKTATKHRDSERTQRHKQIALESVNSFIEDLEPLEQQKIKQKIAEEFFTLQKEPPAPNDAPITLSNPHVKELLKLFSGK
jgi:hypothetical protein